MEGSLIGKVSKRLRAPTCGVWGCGVDAVGSLVFVVDDGVLEADRPFGISSSLMGSGMEICGLLFCRADS